MNRSTNSLEVDAGPSSNTTVAVAHNVAYDAFTSTRGNEGTYTEVATDSTYSATDVPVTHNVAYDTSNASSIRYECVSTGRLTMFYVCITCITLRVVYKHNNCQIDDACANVVLLPPSLFTG